MFITQKNITALSPDLVRALRSVLYTHSIQDRYASNVSDTLRTMGEHTLAKRLDREAARYNALGLNDKKTGILTDFGNLADDAVYDLSREYTDPLT